MAPLTGEVGIFGIIYSGEHYAAIFVADAIFVLLGLGDVLVVVDVEGGDVGITTRNVSIRFLERPFYRGVLAGLESGKDCFGIALAIFVYLGGGRSCRHCPFASVAFQCGGVESNVFAALTQCASEGVLGIYTLAAVGNYGVGGSCLFAGSARQYTVYINILPNTPFEFVDAAVNVEVSNISLDFVGFRNFGSYSRSGNSVGSFYALPLTMSTFNVAKSTCLQVSRGSVTEENLLGNNLCGDAVVVDGYWYLIRATLIFVRIAVLDMPVECGTRTRNTVCCCHIKIVGGRRTVFS